MPEQPGDPVRARYAEAAHRIAAGGQAVAECDAERFGAGLYAGADLDGLESVAGASLGCGNPVAVLDLRPGETVLDLGSGGGLDVLVSARRVGPEGRAIGLDASQEMLDVARGNAEKAGVANAEFLHGRIEEIPLPNAGVDAVISNCVITLSSDKARVFAEIARVLKPGGRLGISDVLAGDELTDAERAAHEDQVECLSRSLTAGDYERMLRAAGLGDIDIRRTHAVGDKLYAALIRATKPHLDIVRMTAEHANDVLAIFQAGINEGDATFETTAPSWAAFDASKLPAHRFIALDPADGQVLGWVAVSPVSGRCVYAGVVELSVYVHPRARGRGVGRTLLDTLIASTETAGIWTIQAGVFPENTASLALHAAAGFRVIGTRERVGRHHGVWRDVVLLERRSSAIT